MPAQIIDGKVLSQAVRDQIAKDAAALLAQSGIKPGLAAILVGDDPASHLYVKNKEKACEAVGIYVADHKLPASTSQAELLALIDKVNRDPQIHGILVQLPLPKQIDSQVILKAVLPEKDADGFHPYNMGRLVEGTPIFEACTPRGVIKMIESTGVGIAGKRAVVVGRSNIVGKPVALMLLHRHATVTICHSKTRDLPAVVRRADLVVAALGRPAMVGPDWIHPGATVIDVGINRLTDAGEAARLFANFPERLEQFRQKGSALIGDVHPDAAQVAGALTPVPGGVGPLTIAMLMSNTVKAARLRHGQPAGATAATPGAAATH